MSSEVERRRINWVRARMGQGLFGQRVFTIELEPRHGPALDLFEPLQATGIDPRFQSECDTLAVKVQSDELQPIVVVLERFCAAQECRAWVYGEGAYPNGKALWSSEAHPGDDGEPRPWRVIEPTA